MPSLVGKPCPDFEIQDVDDRPLRRSDYQGYWLMLVFHRHLA